MVGGGHLGERATERDRVTEGDWIRERVIARVAELGFGVRELARRADVSLSPLAAFLRRESSLTSENLSRVLAAIGLDVTPQR